MSEIQKAAEANGHEITPEDLALINQHTIREFSAEEIFTFKTILCDNEIDRDGEAFSKESLEKMAELFLGKTIITDHEPKAENQQARIYRTEVIEDGKLASTGEPYTKLVARCYLPRLESNRNLITEIEAGIRKELSVGCSIKKQICSICGKDRMHEFCGHRKGETYDGKLCYVKLEEPSDAYEVSFVAVPAQPNAGVTKQFKNQTKVSDNLDQRLLEAFLFLRKEDEV